MCYKKKFGLIPLQYIFPNKIEINLKMLHVFWLTGSSIAAKEIFLSNYTAQNYYSYTIFWRRKFIKHHFQAFQYLITETDIYKCSIKIGLFRHIPWYLQARVQRIQVLCLLLLLGLRAIFPYQRSWWMFLHLSLVNNSDQLFMFTTKRTDKL